MASFKDRFGRLWNVELDYGLADVVKARHRIDLVDLASIGKAFVEMAFSNMRLLGELLYTLCEEEITRLKITPEDFGRGLTGLALIGAKAAIEEAIADFSPGPELREAKTKLFRAANATVKERIGAVSESTLREKMSAALDTSTPESSASSASSGQPLDGSKSSVTPDSAPSGNALRT